MIRRKVVRGAVLLALIPIFICLTFLTAVAWWPYPAGVDAYPASSSFVEDRNAVPLAALVAHDGQWRLPLRDEQINPHLLDAIVAVEDSRFYAHAGVDWRSAAMAAWEDVRGLRIRRGASTLTMQVQRLRDPKPRTFFNKFEQAVRAAQVEKAAGKRQILVEYVNRAPFGGNLVGAGAASWRYFGRPCSQLSLGEAALLAGLPQSPNRLRPDRYPQRAMYRRNHVLDRMFALGMIDQKQHDEACREAVAATWRALPQDRDNPAPTAEGAMPTLAWLAARYAGATQHTTIDSGVQRQAAQAAGEHLARLESSGVTAAAVVVLDTQSAECLAAVSLSRGTENVDLTRRPRSTGSTLKPFIYASAFESGLFTPETMLQDSPTAWAGYEPADYDHKFRGTLSAAEALAESRNIPAMLVLAKVGVEPAVGLMEAAGLKTLARSPGRYGLSLAIGGAEASAMELAQAYAMLGRGGVGREVRFAISREPGMTLVSNVGRALPAIDSLGGQCPPYVKSASVGSALADALRGAHAPQERVRQGGPYEALHAPRCLTSSACWQTLTALSGADRTAAICPAAARLHVAWKTGTSNGHRDAWCAAVTRHRTVIVWLGNADGRASSALVGAEAAAPLALRLIASLESAPSEPWPTVIAKPEQKQPDR
ncbi:MAG TPA: transglycosylase domain-containing protein, partial [Rhizomicrobium sp.]|nr:transglycosylase domain-containing protein [Rhizomicrobium sp.]